MGRFLLGGLVVDAVGEDVRGASIVSALAAVVTDGRGRVAVAEQQLDLALGQAGVEQMDGRRLA